MRDKAATRCSLLARLLRLAKRWLMAICGGCGVGRLAQLVEHLVYTERVGGSSPSPPTGLRASGATAGMPALIAKAARRSPTTALYEALAQRSASPNTSA